MALIDIGAAATDRASAVTSGFTFLAVENPANDSGVLDTVEIWAATSLSGCKVGTFFLVAGTDYKCRDSVSIGSVTAGSKQTFSSLSLDVVTGDFIGLYYSSGTIERDLSGSGYYTVSGDHVTVDDQSTYSLTASRTISLYAEQTATILSLAGTVNGVSSVTGDASLPAVTVLGLAGTVNGVSSVTGDLTVVSVLSLAGTVAGVSSVTGELTYKKGITTFPTVRPGDYDPDLVWDEVTQGWVSDEDLLTRDGSRYHSQLVTIAKDLIYYEVIS